MENWNCPNSITRYNLPNKYNANITTCHSQHFSVDSFSREKLHKQFYAEALMVYEF